MRTRLSAVRTHPFRRFLGALVAACALAAGLAPAAIADLRVSPNRPLLPASDPVYGRDAVGLAVNPRDEKHIVAVYTDLDTFHCEVATSFDGGRKWRRTRLKAPPGFLSPPCTVGPHLSALLDQSIAFGRGRNVYTTFSSSVVGPTGESQGKSVLVARSTDGGRSFGTGVVAMTGGPTVAKGPDLTLPKLTVKPGAAGEGDRVYVVASANEQNPSAAASQEDIVTNVSGDGGQTWAGIKQLNPEGQNAIEPSKPVLGRGGALHIAWRTRERGTGGAFVPEGRIMASRSTDLGGSWAHTPIAGVRGYVYDGPPMAPFLTQRIYTASSWPRLAADPRSGNVYVTYGNGGTPTSPSSARSSDHFIHPDTDVWFQRSIDRGSTWSQPARLNRQAPIQGPVTQTRHPSISVAPDGRLDIVWQDRRHWYRGCVQTHAPCEEARLGDTYYRYSDDAGAKFSAERRITDRSMNNDVGFDYRYGAYWAYGPQSVPLGRDRTLVAWMDSRDGNPETDTMGIYLAEVDHDASRNVPVQTVNRTSSADLAVQFSRMAYPGGGESVLAGVFASRPWSRVVIVNERDMAGALAGGVLARANLAPVLVTPQAGLTDEIKQELTRLAPVGAYLIGGEGSLSPKVAADLAATGIAPAGIIRIAGSSRESTAALIAAATDRRTPDQKTAGRAAFDAAVIVNPRSPDAAAASVLAANRRLPVLYVDAGSVPAATADALKTLGIPRTLVIGGARSIQTEVLAGLPSPQRLAGRDALGTSRAVMGESRRRGLPTNIVYAADAARRMDAAVMGASVGRMGGLLMLTSSDGDASEALQTAGLRPTVDRLITVQSPQRRRER